MPKYRLGDIRQSATTSKRYQDMDFIRAKIDAKLEKIRKKIELVLLKNVELSLRRNRVMKALLNPQIGVRGYDLAAEFGLKPLESQRAHYLILSQLLKTCRVKISKQGQVRRVAGRPSVVVSVKTSFLNPEDYESKFKGKPFAYTSNGNKIDWMNWVLNGRRGTGAVNASLKSIKNYGILYGFHKRFRRKSRSGRALMIPEYRVLPSGRKVSNHNILAIRFFPYEFPQVAIPIAGRQNFIDEVARDSKLIEKMESQVNTIIRNNLKSKG